MKVNKILVSQPRPAVIEKSPFYEFAENNGLSIDYKPLIKAVGVTLKEFRAQRTDILDHTTMIFSSRTTIDSFFRICEEARITVPETMKYICNTEAVALYLQKYIIYRKRKISFADGTFNSLLELIVKHKDEKFMLALTEPFKPELPETLSKLKLKVSPVVFARTVSADMSELKPTDYDIIALYSPNDVKALVENFEPEQLPVVATFGEATLRAAKEAGLKVKASAPSPEAPSMVKALDIYCHKVAEGLEVADAEVKEDSAKEEFIRAQQTKLQKKTRTRTVKKSV
ncbi:MAG: uroporphyrinogen-III synthase [Alistipes sp.]|uniref:uroporphyrinogen-III synthase n=1 Tax=Alistipes sp. TaxID=1872444 RepID=UPI001B439AD2|nr:uroporphyrinogen-III synthase [Alistipes sp.]